MAVQYEVIGKANVHGFDPGERFHADLEPAHEARMLRGGYLRIVPKRVSRAPALEQSTKELKED